MENYLKLGHHLRRFVELIVGGVKPVDAVREIRPHLTSPSRTAYKWRNYPTVSAAIDELEHETIRESGITRLSILRRLNQVVDRCMQAEPVLDRKGEPTGEYEFDSAGANRGLELLGKYHKLWTDKVEATERAEITAKVEVVNARERNLSLIKQVTDRITGGNAAGAASAGPRPTDG